MAKYKTSGNITWWGSLPLMPFLYVILYIHRGRCFWGQKCHTKWGSICLSEKVSQWGKLQFILHVLVL